VGVVSARYGRTGRVKPAAGGWEVAIWYLMRVTGLGLFVLVLSHYLILHVLYDPAQQHSGWIAEVRWSSTFWRAFDWLMLMLVLFHAFMGMRTVVADYSRGGTRMLLTTGLYILAALLLVMGTVVVMTLPAVVPAG
jgi:succinate dehydrogenase / fumarate reductase, membrane anchor subunit